MSAIQVLFFNQEGIDTIKAILANKENLFIRSNPTISNPAIIKDDYKNRINRTNTSISFTTDVISFVDTLLIQDKDIIYSVFSKEDIEPNQQYTSIQIQFSNKDVYNLKLDKIIGVVKDADRPEHKYWSDVAQEINDDTILPSMCIAFFKINENGKKYIESKIWYLKSNYIDMHKNVKGHQEPNNLAFMNKIGSRVDKSKLLTDGVIKFTMNVEPHFEMFVLKQNDIIFSVLNNTKTTYRRGQEYSSINVFINQKEYLIDLNDVIGIVKTDNPERTYWYELAKEISDSLPHDNIDTSFQPTYLLKATAATAATNAATAATVPTPGINDTKIKKSLSESVYNKNVKELEGLKGKEQCNEIIQELKKIDDLNISMLPKPTIRNPKHIINPKHRSATIAFDSDIVLTALYKCYTDYKDLDFRDVIDLQNLDFTQAKSKSKPTTKIIRLNDIVESSIIETYKSSCHSLKTKKDINFVEYLEHMQILIDVLQAIYRYFPHHKYNQITFNLFDKKTLDKVITHIKPSLDITKETNIDRGIVFNDTKGVKNKTDVLKNTFLDRAIHLYFSENPRIKFNHRHEHKKYNDTLEYHKYICILPKYHCLDTTELPKNDKNIILKILAELNEITSELPDEYQIIGRNKDVYISLFERISSYTDENALRKLLYVLINNNYNKKQGIEDYYYYFPYDGPAPAISLLNAVNYVNDLKTYQPLIGIDRYLPSIESYYKGTSPLFSRVVNEGLQNHIINGVKLTENTTRKIENVMQYTKCSHNPNYRKEDIYVFHGTQNLMHAKGKSEINLVSFLSCSFNIYISIDYALNNLMDSVKIYEKGIVYVFKIEKHQNYINFDDGLFQILLLPGTKIIIREEINIGHIKYVLCHIDDTDVLNYGNKVLEDIKQGTSLLMTAYKLKHYNIYRNVSALNVINMIFPTVNIQYRGHVENIFVKGADNQRHIYMSLGKLINNYDMHTFNNIQYTIHQHFFNNCYRHFNVNCPKYILGYDKNNIYTVWDVDDSYEPSHGNFKYNIRNLLIDSLLGNIDCTNSKNYLVLKTDTSTSKLMTIKGCGMFNTSGYRKPRFNKTQEPFEYLGIIGEIMHTIPNIQNMDISNLRSLLDCDGFLRQLESFEGFLNTMCKRYQDFLKDHTNLGNKIQEVTDGILTTSFQTPSQEFNELSKMLSDIKDILIMRTEYFKLNMNDVLSNILEYMSDMTQAGVVTGGKHNEELQDIALTDIRLGTKYRSRSTNENKHSPSRNRKHTYEMIKNIPIPTDTKYKLKHLAEPYKSYYLKLIKQAEKSNERQYRSYETPRNRSEASSRKYKSLQDDRKYDNYIVDTYNEGYCVSNKTFDAIKRRLSMK